MCVAGTAGDNCNEVVSKCHSNCNNNGKCIDLSDQKYKCVCEDSYTGEFCETRVEPCYPNPCFNEGSCLVKNTKEFQCVCKNGYNGQTCEVRISFCILQKDFLFKETLLTTWFIFTVAYLS